ncbi:MAG: ImmA/IrrE family metallo-endopeptidase [Actinobacteria bacterium]|nr:ImmA/IrrE family metallo-endopeptidase [Actinomycetota bacterium]
MFEPWELIEKENIEVFYTDKQPEKINAVYDRDETGAIITLKKGLGRIEERCVLSHELGHHFLSAGNSITTCYSLVERINLSRAEK